jgi:hypothetical protein
VEGLLTPTSATQTTITTGDEGNGSSRVLLTEGFSRKAIDDAFGSGTSNKGFTKHGHKTRDVAETSSAVKAGLVLLRKDRTTIDQRCSAVRAGLVTLDEDGNIIKGSSPLCQEQVIFNKDDSVSKTSPAVKSRLVLLKQNGGVDKRCSAVKKGWVEVDESSGSVVKGESALCQRLHLKETNGSHICGFEVADKIAQRKLLSMWRLSLYMNVYILYIYIYMYIYIT